MRSAIACVLCLIASVGCAGRRGGGGGPASAANRARAIHHNNLAVSLMDQGMAMNDRKYFTQAVREFERATMLDSANSTLQTNAARALYFAAEPGQESAQKNYRQARTALQTAMKLNPKQAGPHFMLGLLDKHGNDPAATIASFRAAAKHDPDDWSCHYQLGAGLFRASKFSEAEAPLRKAIKLNPGSREAAYQLYMTLQRLKRPAEAEKIDFARLPEPAQGEPNYFYLRPGKLTETVALKPAEVPIPSRGGGGGITPELAVNFKHGGHGSDPEVAKSRSGQPMPRDWFIKNKLRLVSAIGSGVAAGDFDDDGWCDVFFPNCNGKNALLRNDKGKFVDVTALAGVGGIGEMAMAAVWGDYDNDGKLDLLVTFYGGATLYRNTGGGKFSDVTKHVGLDVIPRGTWCTGAAFADLDHDADLDFYICGYVDLSNIANQPTLRFPEDFAGSRNFLFRNNTLDRTKPKMPGYGAPKLFTEIAKEARVTGNGRKALNVVFSDFNEDNAVDFYVVNDGEPNQLFWNLRDRTFREVAKEANASYAQRVLGPVHAQDADNDGFFDLWVNNGNWLTNARSRGVPQFSITTMRSQQPQRAVGVATADFNNDNVPDRVENRNGERAVLPLGLTSYATHFVKIRASARAIGDSPQSNRSSIGAKIEVLAPGVWRKQEIRAGGGYLSCDSFDLCFNLGSAKTTEFVRGIWPSGIRGSVTGAKAGTLVKLAEPAGIPPSCPYVYFWNGTRFEFLADTLAGGTLGELISPTQYLPLDPDEWMKIDGARIKPRDGAYELRLVNQNPETDFVDEARLLAVDHPAEVEVFPNERMTGPPFPQTKVWAVRDARPPLSAFDDTGRDVLSRISKVDRVYHAEPRPLPWRGFAQSHSLTLDLGPFAASPVLLLNGYIEWGGSSTALGAGQAGVLYAPPKLEVIGRDGRWRTALADMGYPAGRARTIVVPLAGVFPTNDHRIRITTNMTIYWDEIRVAFEADSPLTTHHSPLTKASVQRSGYPRDQASDGNAPPIPNYQQRDSFRDYPTQIGAFTAYGDATPLIRATDDEYVILNHGDELRLRFGQGKLPPVRRGWKRDLLVYFFGYGKSTDVNTSDSLTVGPLPFRAMSGYPYSRPQAYPFARHAESWLRYQTRTGYERIP